MATAAAAFVTFAEFEQLPDSPGSRLELHHGEVVNVPPPIHSHKVLQRQIRRALESALPPSLIVETEVGFKLGQQEYRIADIAVLKSEIWNNVPRGGYLEIAPEVSIEVLSPSNTALEMLDKEQLCLENGCREFWIVDPRKQTVRISTPTGHFSIYKAGDQIPLLYGGALPVDALFA